ncbi:malto-oligosyltrehalose trehalohydrolase [Geomesophilobacter sediminis]|uniref:Malto-oligosyltrehalose trehalohydrolase n=1 Tax=Geomesophilobacter sediminis TaxID=2798584 RepID=A0A8J7JK37_9BACT|nr:malto-oligosyltrehalose trehalohydrolase [Geomesophilobacter sediminis]MBJ6723545.1 malto-oligosyltrehalose trehalohydrolase [Geomesophilobacter sediminis]
MSEPKRRFPIGAELVKGGVHFRVWAPSCKKLEIVVLGEAKDAPPLETVQMTKETEGYYSGMSSQAGAGSRYKFRINGEDSFPDPASRFQPEGPHGPSQVIAPKTFAWSDQKWRGVEVTGQVIYELHIGTYTREGTWLAAMEELPALVDLGITLVEVMPVADFPGRFGWGYDGVNHFAPTRLYGEPDDMRRFVDRAHALGLGVILDVVYNHFGPEGNYLERYSLDYYSPADNLWGKAINFDGKNNGPVREFFITNAAYWMSEFHLDGLRFDATHAIFDESPINILGEITEKARQAAGERKVIMIAENETEEIRCLRPKEQKGYGMDCVWNDDFHHSAHVSLTGYHDAYYSEFLGAPQELISTIKWSYLFQGQRYFWEDKRRGTPTMGYNRSRFINFTQNHDQIGNSAWGIRLHKLANPATLRAVVTLLLLAPQTPMLFQGQEYNASTPFLYFADLSPEIAEQVHAGRIEFLKEFTNIDSPEIIATIDKPSDPNTFEQSKLDLTQRQRHDKTYALYRDLIALRREDPVFQKGYQCQIEGAVLGPNAFLLRYFLEDQQRLLLFNLGRELHLAPSPEPMLAPPEGCHWDMLWSSERIIYGGSGTPSLDLDKYWRVQGNAAVVLVPEQNEAVKPHKHQERTL